MLTCPRYPEPGIFAAVIAYMALNLRRVALRYLFLPRIVRFEYFSEPDPTTGRIFQVGYLVEPWYNRATFWNRWGPEALITRVLGGLVPGSGGEKMLPHGFLFEDIGPFHKMGKGLEAMEIEEERLRKARSAGCPFVSR